MPGFAGNFLKNVSRLMQITKCLDQFHLTKVLDDPFFDEKSKKFWTI